MAEQTREQLWEDFLAGVRGKGAAPETLQRAEEQLQRAKDIDELETKVMNLIKRELGISLKFHSKEEFTYAMMVMVEGHITGVVLDDRTIIVPKSKVHWFDSYKPTKLAVMAEEGSNEYKLLEVIFGDDLPALLKARKK